MTHTLRQGCYDLNPPFSQTFHQCVLVLFFRHTLYGTLFCLWRQSNIWFHLFLTNWLILQSIFKCLLSALNVNVNVNVMASLFLSHTHSLTFQDKDLPEDWLAPPEDQSKTGPGPMPRMRTRRPCTKVCLLLSAVLGWVDWLSTCRTVLVTPGTSH